MVELTSLIPNISFLTEGWAADWQPSASFEGQVSGQFEMLTHQQTGGNVLVTTLPDRIQAKSILPNLSPASSRTAASTIHTGLESWSSREEG